ncbi:MAG: hypothetical protein LBJ36_08110 [Synergistaceae bacterium]|nr:hypothetical protein [Synergistaceae bacterium]
MKESTRPKAERKRGREEGKEGRAEEHVEVTRNILSDGFPINKIVKYTMLPWEEVEKLLH